MTFTGRHLRWKLEPITYKRAKGGHGIMIGEKHYMFDEDGGLERCGPITEAELIILLKQVFPNPSEALAGGAEYIKDKKAKKEGE
jgi:hypothetical protein